MAQSKAIETVVGVFIALGLAAIVVLALKVSNISTLAGNDGYEIQAKFDNIGGLKVRSPVKMAGVLVGRVAEIMFDEETYEAVAVMKIDPKYRKIPEDTTANIYTAGLLGEQYISLEAGGAEDYLEDGGEIEITQSAVVLEQVIGQVLYNKASGDGDKE